MYSIEIKDDELSIQSKEFYLRSILGFLGFLLTLIPLGRLFIVGDDDGLWVAIVGALMVCLSINYTRKLILCRRELVAENQMSVIWPIRSVKRQLEEYSLVMVCKFVNASSDGMLFTTHQVHLIDEEQPEARFLCGSWWHYDEAVVAGTKIAEFLNLALIDACLDDSQLIEPEELGLTQAQRGRRRGEFKSPERPNEIVTEIDFGQEGTSLFIPAPGGPSLTFKSFSRCFIPQSWSVAIASVFVAVLLLLVGSIFQEC